MRVLLTITKDKRNIYCGHAFLMDNLLIEHARSSEGVKHKIKQALANMYEITPDALHFIICGKHTEKATSLVSRLRRCKKPPRTEVWFDSRYFDVH